METKKQTYTASETSSLFVECKRQLANLSESLYQAFGALYGEEHGPEVVNEHNSCYEEISKLINDGLIASIDEALTEE